MKRIHTPLDELARSRGLVFVPVAREVAERLEAEEEGPLYVRITADPEGHGLLRQMVFRKADE